MKVIILSVCLFVLSSLVPAQQVEKQIDQLMQKYQQFHMFNGTVLVAGEEGIIFKKGYGYADMEWDIPNQPDTKFRLGSITKQFTSMLIMQLVEEGKIKLDGKITDYLDYYRKDNGDKVTIHMLLTHTSGIPSYTGHPDFQREIMRKYYAPDDFVKAYCSGDFEFEPGSQFSYNNSGYFILGAIIEKITGKSYADYLQERIFGPLEMSSSGYDTSDPIIKKRASGYERSGSGYVNAAFLDMSLPYAAGSLYSTVEDMYKWDRALYTNELLSEEYKELYFKPYVEAFGGHYAYGIGISKNKTYDPERELTITEHGGGINGFNTLITRIIDDKKLVVLLNNTGGTRLNEMSSSILSILYGKEYPEPRKPIILHLEEMIGASGIDAAVKEYKRIEAEEKDKYVFREQDMNSLGYNYLRLGKIDEALAIFKLNVETYPNGFNTYDSYAEALNAAGNKDEAIVNYKKSLELNPRNQNAIDILKKLGAEVEAPKEYIPAAETLSSYVGKYQLAPEFIITITTEGNRIFAQATNQPKFEIFAESEDKFFLKVVEAQIKFNRGDGGDVNGLTLFQNGREMPASKIE